MNYVEKVSSRLKELLPDCDDELIGLYTLLAFSCGPYVMLDDIHDAWSIWQSSKNPTHPALVPFTELTPAKQYLDTKYADAVAQVAIEVLTTQEQLEEFMKLSRDEFYLFRDPNFVQSLLDLKNGNVTEA